MQTHVIIGKVPVSAYKEGKLNSIGLNNVHPIGGATEGEKNSWTHGFKIGRHSESYVFIDSETFQKIVNA